MNNFKHLFTDATHLRKMLFNDKIIPNNKRDATYFRFLGSTNKIALTILIYD